MSRSLSHAALPRPLRLLLHDDRGLSAAASVDGPRRSAGAPRLGFRARVHLRPRARPPRGRIRGPARPLPRAPGRRTAARSGRAVRLLYVTDRGAIGDERFRRLLYELADAPGLSVSLRE